MREEFFQEVCETEDLMIRGPEEARSHGWIFEPDRQRALLTRFWGKLKPRSSLIFYYCNHGNPLDENTRRIVVGVGRIAEVGPQLYFGSTSRSTDQYPVWSRRITQSYPGQGVRIPYQEYLRDGRSAEGIICRVPGNALLPFSYGGEHVSDDVAVSILERVIQCVERVGADGHVAGAWDQRLAWLNDVLAETWSGRGPFPGAGSVLQYLEALLSKLARFELTPAQVQRIANPEQRAASGIDATEDALVANPYILSESDLGAADSDPVALETIDHGVWPSGEASLFPADDEVSHDDRRRVRAVGVAVLRDASADGSLWLSARTT